MTRIISSALVFALVLSCASGRKTNNAVEGDALLPFIEFYTITEGKAISGVPGQGRRIDGPGYSYDAESQTLDIYRNKPADSLNVMLYIGVGKVLKGTAGHGVSSNIIAVESIPYSYGDFTVLRSTKSSLECLLKGVKIELKPGQEYTTAESKTDSLPNSSVVQTTTTWRIAFVGFVKKNQ